MVSYEYQELFYKSHQVKDILVVDANATVTPVTGEAPTITDATIEIHTEDFESERFQLDECLCAEDNLRFGLCESAKVEFRIKNKADIPNLKSSEYGDLLNIYLYFNGDSDTLFQIGQYTCFKDDYTNNRKMREIELYDLNYTLNDLDITSWYNRYFSDGQRKTIIFAIADLFNWINKSGTYANDDSSPNIHIEIDPVYTLCNGAFLIGKTIESDTITFGFFMQGLLEFNGCFGHITRKGKFKFLLMESYDKTPCRTVTDDFRKPPTNYSDDNTWGIGQLDVYDRNNVKKFSKQNTDKKKPSIYVMVDPWVIADRESGDSATETALQKLLLTINHYNYNKSETECSGDLCIEVGDRYNVEFTQASQYDTRNWFRSYVLERHFSGIQSMHDTYTAKGDKKQPLYQIPNENWHVGDSTSATQGSGTGGVAELYDEHDKRLIQLLRNLGYRILDQPTAELVYNKESNQVEITWTDPQDFIRNRPIPATWAKTIVVRKEGSAPIHQWGVDNEEYGGDLLVTSTTRDEFSETPFIDDTIEPNKRYYYAIMPGSLYLDDETNPIYHYNWTKVFSVDTQRILVAPTILALEVDGTSVTVGYIIPALEVGTYASLKLLAKKDNIPTSIEDADKVIDITEPANVMRIGSATMSGLDELSHYYFVVLIEDDIGIQATSEPKDIVTGRDEGYNFDYTGQIQTFTAPKTGIYQLETWGAQGGNATDGTLTARGGYGAYAKGEVLLTQGETIYINVGGQNGYGGGGNASIVRNLSLKTTDVSHYVTGGNGDGSSIPTGFSNYIDSDYILWTVKEQIGYTTIPLEFDNQEVIAKTYTDSQNNFSGYVLIPFSNISNVIKVEFDVKAENVIDDTCNIWCLERTLDYNKSFRLANISQDTDWTHISVDVDSSKQENVFNYLRIQTSATKTSIKNMVFVCSQ